DQRDRAVMFYHISQRIGPVLCWISRRCCTAHVLCHNGGEERAFGESPRHIAVRLGNPPTFAREMKIEPQPPQRWPCKRRTVPQPATDRTRQAQHIEQLRECAYDLKLCRQRLARKLFRPQCELHPLGLFEQQWKRRQRGGIANLWVPFATFEHCARTHLQEKP